MLADGDDITFHGTLIVTACLASAVENHRSRISRSIIDDINGNYGRKKGI